MKLILGVVCTILLLSLISSAKPKRKSKKYNESRSRVEVRTYQSQTHNSEFVVGMVKLHEDYFEYICAGVILTEYWVLTSGTCALNPTYQQIVLGKVVLRGGTKWIEGNGGFDHLIDAITAYYEDVPGFIKVKNGFINYPYESRVPLLASKLYNYTSIEAETFQWAEAVNEGIASEVLQSVTVDIISNKECDNYNNSDIGEIGTWLVCGVIINGFFCDADGGAPLVRGNVLIGISKKVDGVCDPNRPMVFFRVSEYIGDFQYIINDTSLKYSPPI